MEKNLQMYFSETQSELIHENKHKFNPPIEIEEIIKVERELNIEFPQDYKEFLLITNGYEGSLGQSYVQLVKVEELAQYTEMYGGEFFPWVIYLGSDGGNEMFVLDKREDQLQFGVMPFIGNEEDFIPLGNTFEKFVRHLYYNDYWEYKK